MGSAARGGALTIGVAAAVVPAAGLDGRNDSRPTLLRDSRRLQTGARPIVSTTAALKGRWEAVQLEEPAAVSGVRETYERTEYNGAPETDAPIVINEWPCTYLSDTLRVCRYKAGEGEEDGDVWRSYERDEGDKAQAQIGRLLELPVPRVEEIPLWARDRPDSSPPGGGPMADSMR